MIWENHCRPQLIVLKIHSMECTQRPGSYSVVVRPMGLVLVAVDGETEQSKRRICFWTTISVASFCSRLPQSQRHRFLRWMGIRIQVNPEIHCAIRRWCGFEFACRICFMKSIMMTPIQAAPRIEKAMMMDTATPILVATKRTMKGQVRVKYQGSVESSEHWRLWLDIRICSRRKLSILYWTKFFRRGMGMTRLVFLYAMTLFRSWRR
mmetsp:Transcript_6451/g.18010  ORF Transcript_6451/g.18010 Transcript_6451/m.18010 type:complete len:208 (+) Transcript_6451:1236-1859(+)